MGYAHGGNEALIKCFTEGIERSIEVLVPSPWFPEAVKMLAENSGVDVGIHLAITSEWDNLKWRPISDCPSLKDPDGYFYPMVSPTKNYPGRSIKENKWDLKDVEKEWRAQIELGLKKIPRVSHLSAHMGCSNLDESTRSLVKRLAIEYKLDIDPMEQGTQYVSYKGPHATSEEKIESLIKMIEELTPGIYLFVDHQG
jgi:chitin disaccharide deacetylase